MTALLTEVEAAQRMRLCAKSLGSIRRRGGIRFVQIGRKVLYTEADVDEYIASCTRVAQPAATRPPARRQRSGNVVLGRFSERYA